MINAVCEFCNWRVRVGGVYEAHRVTREHLKEKHISLYAEMVDHERALRSKHAELTAHYGWAVRPLSMNL